MFFLPTYNRPERLRDVLSVMPPHREIVTVFVNGPDNIDGYRQVELDFAGSVTRFIYHPVNIGVCAAMNKCFTDHPDEAFYGLICDDEKISTPGWDARLAQAAGQWGIAHANDGWQSEKRIHSYVTVGGDLVRACGWWALPGLWHWYHDDVQEYLARRLSNRVFCAELRSEHRHYMAGAAPKDDTYALGELHATRDKLTYDCWLHTEAPALIHHIRLQIQLQAVQAAKAASF